MVFLRQSDYLRDMEDQIRRRGDPRLNLAIEGGYSGNILGIAYLDPVQGIFIIEFLNGKRQPETDSKTLKIVPYIGPRGAMQSSN